MQKKFTNSFTQPITFSSRKLSAGFTMLEMLIVISVIALLLTAVIPSFLNFRRSSLLNTETMDFVTLVNRARLLSVSSKNDSQYGVHLEAGRAVLFMGPTYSASSPSNETHVFPTAITLSNIIINGGGVEVLFEKVTGATIQNATTTLLVAGTTASTTLLIFPTGIITTN